MVTNMSNSKIRLFKLVTGEEIIGSVEYGITTDEQLKIARPRVLAMTPVGPGQVSLALVPWFMSNPDGTFIVNKNKIVAEPEGDTPRQLEDAYLQQTSGIQLATGTVPRGK